MTMFRIISKSGSKSRRRRTGNTLVEASLVMPVLIYLVLGAMQFGYYFFVKNTLQAAAREGCRSGIVLNSDNTNVTQAVAGYLKAAGLNSSTTTLDSKYTLKIESPQGTSTNAMTLTSGSSLCVTIQATWGNVGLLMLPPQLGGLNNAKIVAGVSVMRKEG
jgi:Flp pilus assembly protein TadG